MKMNVLYLLWKFGTWYLVLISAAVGMYPSQKWKKLQIASDQGWNPNHGGSFHNLHDSQWQGKTPIAGEQIWKQRRKVVVTLHKQLCQPTFVGSSRYLKICLCLLSFNESRCYTQTIVTRRMSSVEVSIKF